MDWTVGQVMMTLRSTPSGRAVSTGGGEPLLPLASNTLVFFTVSGALLSHRSVARMHACCACAHIIFLHCAIAYHLPITTLWNYVYSRTTGLLRDRMGIYRCAATRPQYVRACRFYCVRYCISYSLFHLWFHLCRIFVVQCVYLPDQCCRRGY